MGPVRFLLDTCAFLWMAQQPSMISANATAAINDPTNELYLSDISIWEITLKHSMGKLLLPAKPQAWIPGKLAFHQITSLALNHGAIYRSGELPRVHLDPFDRLLAAHAIEEGLIVLSPDKPLSLLGASRVW